MAEEPLADRFRNSLKKLAPGFAGSGDLMGVAVSGGPDSMALLALAQHVHNGRICAATVDHGLRPESADEATMVTQYCAAHRIPHAILTPSQPITGNIQSAARTARYRLLQEWAAAHHCTWIATAHHGDDQLETMLMRLARGAGIDGLSGVRAVNGNIIRPLLEVRKADLIAYCEAHGIPYTHDPSNADHDFDRVRMRTALDGLDMLDVRAANNSARALAQAGAALDWMVAREAALNVSRQHDAVTLRNTDYPAEILRRLLLHCVQLLAPELQSRGDTVTRTIAALQAGEKTMIGDILCEGGAVWKFRPAPPRGGK